MRLENLTRFLGHYYTRSKCLYHGQDTITAKFTNTNLKHGGKPRCACTEDIRHMDIALVFCYHTVRGASNNGCTPKDLNSRLSRKYNQPVAGT